MRMKSVIAGVVTTVLLSLPAAAAPGQLRAGLGAFARQDYIKAAALLQLPARQGNPNAQAAICYMFTFGRGLPQSNRAAAYWCRRAANQGSPQAQYMLGLLYNKGHGVPEDFVLAYKWLNLAASHSYGPKQDFSFRIRNSVASKMSPAQIARAQALSLAWRPVPERGALAVYPCPPERCAELDEMIAPQEP